MQLAVMTLIVDLRNHQVRRYNKCLLFYNSDLGADIRVAIYLLDVFICERYTAEGPVDIFIDEIMLILGYSMDTDTAADGRT